MRQNADEPSVPTEFRWPVEFAQIPIPRNRLNAIVRATKKMPNPQALKIGDRVRFISLPEEWKQPGYEIHGDSISFMKRMIKRTSPLRVTIIDEFGTPWVSAITIERGRRNYHSWAITEKTGWRMVVPRKKRNAQPS